MSQKLRLPLLGQPDPNAPKDVHLVGRYAVGVTWGDDHGSIYPFERLRRDCPCGACAALETIAPTAAWPTEITRTGPGLRVVWADAHESLYPYPDLRGLCRCAGCTGGH
ncbi:MAG: gamma-butyrobetaine hydroxylase-like domain-containing protein [Candidatus Rokuibacteriota bacterium]